MKMIISFALLITSISAFAHPCDYVDRFTEILTKLEKNDSTYSNLDWVSNNFESIYNRQKFLDVGSNATVRFNSYLGFAFGFSGKIQVDAYGMSYIDLTEALKSNAVLATAFAQDGSIATLKVNTRDLYEQEKSEISLPKDGYKALKAKILLDKLCPETERKI